MPGYRTHLVGGAVAGAAGYAIAAGFGFAESGAVGGVMVTAVAVIGALLPDIDTDSHGRRLIYAPLILADLVLIARNMYDWAAMLGLLAMLPSFGPHRSWTHTWWAMLVFPMPILLLPILFSNLSVITVLPFYLATVAGYGSHLLLDRSMS